MKQEIANGLNDYQSCKSDAQDMAVLERGEIAEVIEVDQGSISTNTFTMFSASAILLIMLVLALTYSSPFDSYGNTQLSKHHSTESEGAVFTVSSSDFSIGDELSNKFACEDLRSDDDKSAGYNPSIQWSNAPANTVEYLVIMTTIYGDDETKYDWIYYSIPSTMSGIPSDISNEDGMCETTYGACGGTSPDRPEYYYKAPCSDGPGPRNYTFTVYALSSPITQNIDYTLVKEDLHDWADDVTRPDDMPDDDAFLTDDGNGFTGEIFSDAITTYAPQIVLAQASTWAYVNLLGDR